MTGRTSHNAQEKTLKIPRPSERPEASLLRALSLLAGFSGGAILSATGTAGAATGSSSSSSTSVNGHAGETALTGTTAAKVKAAALAKYPGATVERVETDSDGVYEAHITTKAGDEVIVQIDKSFAVTGTQTGGGHDDRAGNDSDTSSSAS